MAHTLQFILFMAAFTGLCWAQAPGDEDTRCTEEHSSPPTYPDTERNLMDSYNYEQLLPGNGTGNAPIPNAAWNDNSYDDNDITPEVTNPTYWQQRSGGLCRFQPRVCGWKRDGATQNNWLFTQRISKDFSSSTFNYDVTIHVMVAFSTPNCRERNGCKPWLNIHHYMTNSIQLPSILGSGFMNPANYVKFGEPQTTNTITTHTFILNFTLPSSSTGFYIAAQDPGGCITLSRMRVYRENCKARQIGLALYPSAPAPVSGTQAVKFSCVPNAGIIGTETVGCTIEGKWADDSAQCGCLPGYQINTETYTCEICPEGYYQPLVSATRQCRKCPPQSSAHDEGTDVCECDSGYIRHPDRPDDRCTRSPSPPIFNLAKPPELNGAEVTAIWEPPIDAGGDPEGLYYDVYAAQLERGQAPTFCRQNEEPLLESCDDEGTECKYRLTKLNSNTPYAILVVSANSATDDPECISNITLLGSRYVLMVVGTEDAISTAGLSTGAAVGVTFTVTLLVTAIAVASIIIIIFFFCLRRGSHSKHYSTNGQSTSRQLTTTTLTSVNNDLYERKSPPSPPITSYQEPSPAKKPPPPTKPPAPYRPAPPARPSAPPRNY